MKRLVLFIIFIATVYILHAQKKYDFQYSIAYDMYINYGNRILNKALLNYSNVASCFTYKPFENYNKTEFEEGSDEQYVFLSDTVSRQIWCDKDLNEIVEINNIGSKNYLVVDSISNLNWEILDETREIGGFVCNRASCKFRGRRYTAWFTLNIPCNWGPWKLHGLPGAILEAYDETKEVSFYATNVHKVNRTMVNNNENVYERITYKQYIIKFKEDFSEQLKRGLSKATPGLQISISNIRVKNIELEQ